MYTIHHCKAFILKSADSGEANKMIWLFTKEFGLVVAKVQGVKKDGAKLRAHLIDYTLIDVDLVKGRDVWRLVNAKVNTNPFSGDYDKKRARSYIRALGLVSRFCIEEGEEPGLFEHLEKTLETLKSPLEDGQLFDAIVLWKILILLGYLELEEDMKGLFSQNLLEITVSTKGVLQKIIKDVTDAINRTHL
ncbi:DNA repair protein RecO [Candidatus Nomurabacteria bacterium]|nr:DNA repair protein RecO [Candidatus Nomurabacteria bacterium]